MNPNSKRYRTQWAAQFYAAAELTRRGYLVSLTLGNAPVADLLVVSPSGKHFMVDVKGLSSKNFWLAQEREPQDDLYFILVYLPSEFQPPSFYVLSSAELVKAIKALKAQTLAAGKKWVESGAGINWGTALEYQNRWELLPA
jgi:hypothetical protein